MTVIARGIRKLTSKRAGSVELFNLIRAQIVLGKGNLATLAEVQALETFRPWRKQLGRVTLAYQVCEAVDKLTADQQPHPQVFNILVSALSQIGRVGSNWQDQVQTWLVAVVRDLGYWPQNLEFTGDIFEFMEGISSRSYNSQRLLKRLTS